MPTNYDEAIMHLYPQGAAYEITDAEDYGTLNWLDDRAQPTQALLDNLWIYEIAVESDECKLCCTGYSFLRALDELIDILIDEGTITLNEFSQDLQDLYNERINYRD